MKLSSLLLSAGAALLSGCASEPAHFYTLVPGAAPAGPSAGYQIEVQAVTVPAQVDVPQLVVRQGAGQLAVLEGQQWAAPLGAEIRSSLSQALERRLGAQDIYSLPRSAQSTVYRIKLDLRRFDSWPGQRADIAAIWTVRPVDVKAEPLTCTSTASVPVAAGYPALVQGHQQALAAVAADIAQVVEAWQQAGRAPVCPVRSQT